MWSQRPSATEPVSIRPGGRGDVAIDAGRFTDVVNRMILLLCFSILLLIAVLVSSIAEKSVLSTSVLFLVAGFLAGPDVLHVIQVSPRLDWFQRIVELALFAVLFTDGMHVGWGEFRRAWHLPGRALLLGMPLTMLFTAVGAHFLLNASWLEAALLGAILSPTDPVFASAIVGREEIPQRLRRLLNVESGVNDGLALPFVVVFLAVLSGQKTDPGLLLAELLGGIGIGVAIPYVALKLEQSRFFAASPQYEPLNAFAIGLLVLAAASSVHANLFLAAFAAGMTMATVGPESLGSFHRFGNMIAELLKLGSLMIFGAVISPSWFSDVPALGYLFVAAVLLVIRPLAVGIAMIRSNLPWQQRAVAAWFGPKGFASVAYGLLVLNSVVENRVDLFHWIAVTVAVSIIAHSSTDVAVAHWLTSQHDDQPSHSEPDPAGSPQAAGDV